MSYIGTNKIGKMFLGDTEIAKAYLGSSLVFQNIYYAISSGIAPLTFQAKPGAIRSLIQYGKCEQNGTPAPDAPVDIVCNNGVLKFDSVNQEIYTDGLQETINVHGKNLYDKSNGVIYGYPTSSYTWYERTTDNAELSIMIKLLEGKTYTATRVANTGSNFRIQASNTSTLINGQALQNIDSLSGIDINTKTFTVPEGYPYVIFYVRNTYNASRPTVEEVINGFQVESGSTATPYQPYFAGDTALAEMLLKVGDYKDIQDIISGDVTRRVGIKVLDGTENWVDQLSNSKRIILFIHDILNNNTAPLLVTHGKFAETVVSKDNHWRILAGRYIACYTTESTLADFKAYLMAQYAAGTPIIVIYPLATETTESVTPQSLNTAKGTNIIDVTAEVSDIEIEAEHLV